jgi:ligand-binding sensor domain-containing protein
MARVFPLVLLLSFPCLNRAERLPIKAYSVADGLANNAINKIVRDSRGFLWFCTEEGLSRFDGYAFLNFGTQNGLPHSNVTDLLETRSGEYWVGTNGGIVLFNPKGAPLDHNYRAAAPMFTLVVPEQSGPPVAITGLLEDRTGTIWCGTHNGLFRLVKDTKGFQLRSVDIGLPQNYLNQSFISDLLEDRYGNLWVATPKGLYRRWPDGTAARYTKSDGLPDDYLSDLLQDDQGRLWVATLFKGFFSLTIDDSTQTPRVGVQYSKANGLPSNWVFQLAVTTDHRFWIATNEGLVQFFSNGDEQGRSFHISTTKNGLTYHEISALNEDLGGNLWLGTNTAGAMKLARNGFVSYDHQDAVVQVNAIFADPSGRVCFKGAVLGDERISVFEGAKLELLQKDPPHIHQRFGSFDGENFKWFKPDAISNLGWVMEEVTLQTRNGEWWLGAGDGLYRFPPADSFEAIKTAKPIMVYSQKNGFNPEAFRLFEDSRANIWISVIGSTTYGLRRWERESNSMIDLSQSEGFAILKDNLARSFAEDRSGNVWIGFNKGVGRYAQGSFKFFTAADGLPPGAINDIFLDKSGRLWLASSLNGLLRIDDPAAEHPSFFSYTTAQGLSSNNAEVIVDDVEGSIYVGGGQGLDRLDPANGSVRHFTTVDGLAPGLFRAAFRDQRGTLWFGMTGGVSRLIPAADISKVPTNVLISGLKVSGSPGWFRR